ncbi:MAG: isoprenylcysteine carboxylmethyltransferase family protein [Acidiphilium sp.]|nr:isoprenylcysteine carboxylmethyltransferase family protein [Acidiphilium sp.]MDD4936562.1 isoprenylcysteine carboxylmethyltransferase family protein [Acidiphilium sp.]
MGDPMGWAARLIVYGLLWLSFGIGHTSLASPERRARVAVLAGPAGRLTYNLIAIVHLAIVLGIGAMLFRGTARFSIAIPVHILMLAMAIAGVAILVIAGRSYDLGRFAGSTQWRMGGRLGAGETELPIEPLATGGMNAVVRHPLYLGLLLLMFGISTTPFMLATSVAATIYILIGIHFEERKLLRLYGDDYARYRAKVPMLLPLPRAAMVSGHR